MLVRSPAAVFRRSVTEQIIVQSRSWEEFWGAMLQLGDVAQQGDAFERLTQLYFQTQPEYQSKLRNVWRWIEVPDEVRARLGLPASDEGIDLLAETHQGDLWAVQCKFHSNPDRAVTRQELGTFIALASVAGLSQRVVAHTSVKPIRKRTLLGETVELGLDRWLSLDNQAWSLITAPLQGRPVRPEPRAPRPHQREALAAARRHFHEQGASRGRLIMPCGTGKSLTAFFIAEALEARNILVAVPSLALIRQSLADWTREFLARGEAPDWLCVCSDESVGAIESDSFMADAYDLGIPTTTNQEEIASFLSKDIVGRRITFTTYQSSGRLAEAARQAGTTFDLAVLDEAHRTVGAASKTFATLLRDEAVSIRQRLFMTATERVLRGANDDVLSMDDEGTYGERFFQLTFKEAIAQGIISDYRILTITVSDEQVQEIIQENSLLDLSPDDLEDTEAQAVAAGIALKRVFQEHGINHAISFHRTIRAADRFRDQQDRLNKLTNIGPVTTNLHISSKKTAGQRAELLSGFVRHERALMTNARCLTEGVDIPAIDCVAFVDPKQSVVDIVQAAGRALRRSEGKECGYILLPLIVPSGMDLDAFAETTAFREVARTITALSTQDERIAEEFRAVEQARKSMGRIVEIKGDVPVGLQLDLKDFAEAVSTRIWARVGRANWRSFDMARTFARSLGLRSAKAWRAYLSNNKIPADIPANPDRTYARQGWVSYGDWLGTGNIAKYFIQYRDFDGAREFVRSLKLRTTTCWRRYVNEVGLPPDIPSNPHLVYAEKGWISYGDWLGTNFIHPRLRKYRGFREARAYARSLNLRTGDDWRDFKRNGALPEDIPANPDEVYRDSGWQSWGDWLGTFYIASRHRSFRSFNDARAYVRGLGLRSATEWSLYIKSGQLPNDIPRNPHKVYADKGWLGFGDWLGTEAVATSRRSYRTFPEAREYARSLKLRSQKHWFDFARTDERPQDIPAQPEQTYAGRGWSGWGDWLGTGNIAPKHRVYRPFEDARNFVRGLGLKSQREWKLYVKSGALPSDIPSSPHVVYQQQGWCGLGDWLGTGTVASRLKAYRDFDQARAFAQSLHLRSVLEWVAYTRTGELPYDIPRKPNQVYATKGWQGWGDWLGTGRNRGGQRKSADVIDDTSAPTQGSSEIPE